MRIRKRLAGQLALLGALPPPPPPPQAAVETAPLPAAAAGARGKAPFSLQDLDLMKDGHLFADGALAENSSDAPPSPGKRRCSVQIRKEEKEAVDMSTKNGLPAASTTANKAGCSVNKRVGSKRKSSCGNGGPSDRPPLPVPVEAPEICKRGNGRGWRCGSPIFRRYTLCKYHMELTRQTNMARESKSKAKKASAAAAGRQDEKETGASSRNPVPATVAAKSSNE